MAEQLIFDLPVRTSLGRGDFFVSEANLLAVSRVDASESWPNGKLILVGPAGAGKTHLAHVWAEREGGEVLSAQSLQSLDVGGVDTSLALDDGDRLASEFEPLVFHLHNHLASAGLPFLVTARQAPMRWATSLPDLKSRMEATDSARIDPPDDALLSAVLMKLFADRQVAVSPATITWLTTHMDRSFAEAQRVVAEIDAQALAEGRKVTRDLAARVLDNTPKSGP